MIFYRGNTAVSVDYSANEISSDGAIPSLIHHSIAKLLRQRVFLLMHAYEETNDVKHLQNDSFGVHY